ncbi:MAG: hypothetical protein AABY32_06530, partial [Nanoarchaeota archaeon]
MTVKQIANSSAICPCFGGGGGSKERTRKPIDDILDNLLNMKVVNVDGAPTDTALDTFQNGISDQLAAPVVDIDHSTEITSKGKSVNKTIKFNDENGKKTTTVTVNKNDGPEEVQTFDGDDGFKDAIKYF